MTTDLTAITPRGQRWQAIDNDARYFLQSYYNDSHANGKATLKKNDQSPEARPSNHRKRRSTGPESVSIQRKRIHRQSNPFLGRSESFAQDNGFEDCDDENKSSTLLSQDAAVESFEQPQRLQRLVASEVVGFSDCVAIPRQPSAETKNDPKPHRRSRQSSPRVDQTKSRPPSRMRSKRSRGCFGGTSSQPVGSQRDSGGCSPSRCSPSRATLNEAEAVDLADMVKREVQRQVARVEGKMLAEIDRMVEDIVRPKRNAQMKEGRESSKRKGSIQEQRRRRE